MNFNDDKDDFFDGPDIQEVPKTPKAPLLKPEDRITGSRMSLSLNTCCLRVVTLQYGSV